MCTIYLILSQATTDLFGITPTPMLDAELLLAEILNVERGYLHAYPEKILTAEKKKK